MKIFKIRASATSEIMTNPRRKNEVISQTAKTYCQNWLKEQMYDARKEFSSKYLKKGLINEQQGIDLLIDYDNELYFKNENNYENDYMTGTPDIVAETEIIDIKSSWDVWTFPLFEPDPSKEYWWQLQTYMILTGRDKARLVFTLTDTPDEFIEWELAKAEDEKMFFNIRNSHKFEHLPLESRIKIFTFEKDLSAEAQIIERVKLCRNYIDTLIKN